jgi:predicted RNA-binding protein
MANNSSRYWLVITNDENWDIIQRENIYAINSDNKYKQLQTEDFVVIYLVPKQISGIFKIKNLKSRKGMKFTNKKYKYYFDIIPLIILYSPILIDDKWSKTRIIKNISIFKNAKRWGAVLMGKSILEITKEDFEVFKEALTNKEIQLQK